MNDEQTIITEKEANNCLHKIKEELKIMKKQYGKSKRCATSTLVRGVFKKEGLNFSIRKIRKNTNHK